MLEGFGLDKGTVFALELLDLHRRSSIDHPDNANINVNRDISAGSSADVVPSSAKLRNTKDLFADHPCYANINVNDLRSLSSGSCRIVISPSTTLTPTSLISGRQEFPTLLTSTSTTIFRSTSTRRSFHRYRSVIGGTQSLNKITTTVFRLVPTWRSSLQHCSIADQDADEYLVNINSARHSANSVSSLIGSKTSSARSEHCQS